MLVLLIVHLASALAAPVLVRWCGRRAYYLLAAAPAGAFGWAAASTTTVRDEGALIEAYPWVSRLDLDVTLRVTTLSWLMVLLVGGVGALVLIYCARYFDADEPGLGRFGAVFVGFAGAMLGLVVADNLILLYVFWELTTLFSYLLIGHDPEKRASRRASAHALVVTTAGGLAMLVGFLMLGQRAGTYRWSQIAAAPPPPDGYLIVAVILVLVGALTKSAIFPVSFWLPSAMAAPTPVSAYLHAAAMVKAGVYLVALLAPVFASVAGWHPLIYGTGTVTMIAGGWAALRQTDLKLLLAYGTVSQLGLLIVVSGAGTHDAALAGTALLFAHALFKAALFLVVGIIDRRTGTRDLTALSGLWRRMPLVCAIASLAVASMAGLPLTAGFASKEAVFEAFTPDPVLLTILVIGAMLTVAYGARFLWGAFAAKPGLAPTLAGHVDLVFSAPAGILALAGLATGVWTGIADRLLAPYARLFGISDYHLAPWHGFTLELGLTAITLLGGGLLILLPERFPHAMSRLRAPVDGASGYARLTHRLDRLAVEVTGATQRGSLPWYLGIILLVLVVPLGGTLVITRPWPDRVEAWDSPLQLVVGLVFGTAAVLAVRARQRLTAMVLVGVTGYGTGVIFILHGAPDLALTQFLVETVTIVAFALVLRRLPANFSARPLRRSRWVRAGFGAATGLVMVGLALAASGGPPAVPISVDYPDLAAESGSGRNVINVTLVDIRAWDTMGEIAVLVVAATGVASLIFQRPQPDRMARRRHTAAPVRDQPGPVWLRSGGGRDDPGRVVVFEVIVRLLFHTMVLFSVYLMFSGHNTPGGGFAGGLVAGLAIVVRYLAGGRDELNEAAPAYAGLVLGTGLFLSVATGVVTLLFSGAVLRGIVVNPSLPVVGELHLATSTVFDIGVYLIVIGLVLGILRGLGAEIDRQIEAGGAINSATNSATGDGAGGAAGSAAGDGADSATAAAVDPVRRYEREATA